MSLREPRPDPLNSPEDGFILEKEKKGWLKESVAYSTTVARLWSLKHKVSTVGLEIYVCVMPVLPFPVVIISLVTVTSLERHFVHYWNEYGPIKKRPHNVIVLTRVASHILKRLFDHPLVDGCSTCRKPHPLHVNKCRFWLNGRFLLCMPRLQTDDFV